jgi:hypothetical protein
MANKKTSQQQPKAQPAIKQQAPKPATQVKVPAPQQGKGSAGKGKK